MRELVQAMDAPVPANVREVSEGLQYRDFITVGLLADRLKVKEPDGGLLKDTWIYVQEPDVLLGRLQIFNNWSPYLVEDPTKVWIGLEYFCYDTDPLWKMADEELKQFAIAEVAKIGILDAEDVRMRTWCGCRRLIRLTLGLMTGSTSCGSLPTRLRICSWWAATGCTSTTTRTTRMLTAMTVVDGLVAGHVDKAALWEINTEQEYHEEKK